jgi:hypothetical protein
LPTLAGGGRAAFDQCRDGHGPLDVAGTVIVLYHIGVNTPMCEC